MSKQPLTAEFGASDSGTPSHVPVLA